MKYPIILAYASEAEIEAKIEAEVMASEEGSEQLQPQEVNEGKHKESFNYVRRPVSEDIEVSLFTPSRPQNPPTLSL